MVVGTSHNSDYNYCKTKDLINKNGSVIRKELELNFMNLFRKPCSGQHARFGIISMIFRQVSFTFLKEKTT